MTGPDLKLAIRRIGMTQNEFAAHVGISHITVSRYVNGHAVIPRMLELLVWHMLARMGWAGPIVQNDMIVGWELTESGPDRPALPIEMPGLDQP